MSTMAPLDSREASVHADPAPHDHTSQSVIVAARASPKSEAQPAATLLAALMAALMLAGCARSPFQKVPEAEINQEHRAAAERIAYRLLTSWKEGRYEALSDDFTQEMKDALDPRAQRQTHADIRARMGELESLEFVEAVVSRNPPPLVLYRFRGTFSATKERPEVRVVLDERGRVAGFWCLKWSRTVR